MSNTPTTTSERALSLLGSGIAPERVALALGITPSAVSQLLSDDDFASRVAQLRYETLSKHNSRDSEYDTIEDDLLQKLKDSLCLLIRPDQILRAIAIINAAKRRGQSAPEAITQQSTVVTLVMPIQVIHKFTTNIHNQVIEAGDQKLVTVQSGTLLDQIKAKQLKQLTNAGKNDQTTYTVADLGAGETERPEQETSSGNTEKHSVPAL